MILCVVPGNNDEYTLSPLKASFLMAFFVCSRAARWPDAMASAEVRWLIPLAMMELTCASNLFLATGACFSSASESDDG